MFVAIDCEPVRTHLHGPRLFKNRQNREKYSAFGRWSTGRSNPTPLAGPYRCRFMVRSCH